MIILYLFFMGEKEESMSNENLVSLADRTTEEKRKIGISGGIASGKARREKKTMAQLVNQMMNRQVDVNNLPDDLQALADIVGEEKTMSAYMVAGQMKSASRGNTKAFEVLTEMQDKAEKHEDGNSKWTIPITDITTDFVEVYRVVHDAFDGNNGIREIISKGGRGSIKSNFWSALAEETIYNDSQAHVVYSRRYKTDLRGSVYNQFMKTVIRHGKLDEWEFTTSPMMAKYKKTGQCVVFVGADKPISLKSYNLSFGYVKLLIHEECDEMAGIEQMDNIEDTFLRADTPALDIKVFNPPKSKNNFMNKYVEECTTKESTYIAHSYYYNVPVKWLGQRFFDRAKWFKENKPKYYANNYLGEVIGTGGGIFENIESRRITDDEIAGFDTFHHGLDFGYEHPQTFIQCYYDEENDILYPTMELYAKRCKNSTFAGKLKAFKNVEIICDSARPDNIADMADWGFDVVGATKRWQNKGRAYCWEWLQQCNKIVVDKERTPHLYHELTTLEFEQLRDGTFSSEYPTLEEDCIMALIYSLNRVIMSHSRVDNYSDDDNYSLRMKNRRFLFESN